ncbi:S66 peptidase family protein [Actinomadura flavalba]|uniref:S66 peptidase family protein n=1 Tax=Actinomadura flavalba TaxID=1120938 RepID=UPI00037952AB|nr:LD-carboxypeptidase [Actinomadura flavalba]
MNSGGARPGAGRGGAVLPARPPRLAPGDRVAVVAPSGAVDADRLDAGLAALRALGLDPRPGKHVLSRAGLCGTVPPGDGRHVLAGTDADRAADLAEAWTDPNVRAVLCARGGYGAARVLAHLDWTALAAAAPKILHGSSDVTALHVAFGRRLGVTTSFGPMIAGALAAGPGETADAFRAALFGTGPVTLRGTGAVRGGVAEGPLAGGTLALLASLLGTPDAPAPAAGHIVFLEDVTEPPYRLDRMLVQLIGSGYLEGAAGLVLGSWTDCGDPAEIAAVTAARLGPLGVPVLAGVPAGHGPRQHTLELGAPARLDATALTLDVLPGGAP